MANCICPLITDIDWDMREHRWAERYFLQMPMNYFFRIPLAAPEKMRELMRTVTAHNYVLTQPMQILFQDALFKGKAMIGIEKPEGELQPEVAAFMETYWLTRVHHGPYSTLPNSVRQLQDDLRKKGKTAKGLYFWHVTCPACCRERGGDKTVIWAQV